MASRSLLAAICLLLPGPAAALDTLENRPPSRLFQPDADVYPQNFAVRQRADGLVFLANAESVLVFDGERWEVVATPNGDLVRSLALAGDRVYVGGYNLFGYIEEAPDGGHEFVDLTAGASELLDDGERFADIWDLEVSEHGVFFRALRHLFLYDPATGGMRLWRHEGRFGDLVVSRDQGVLLQFRGEGMRRYQDGDWVPVPETGSWDSLIYDLVELSDGSLITLASDGRWERLVDGRIEPWSPPSGLPASSAMSDGVGLPDGSIALAGDEGSLWIVGADGSLRRSSVHSGYLSEVRAGATGGLLIASDAGVHHLSWPSAWTVIGAEDGISGSLHDVVAADGAWYALTGSGANRLARIADEGRVALDRLPWTEHEAWALIELDQGQLLLADSYALVLVDDERIERISHEHLYPRLLHRSRYREDRIYVGTELGFAVLERGQDGAWTLKSDRDDMDELRVNSLVELGPDRVLIGSERGGALLLGFDEDGTIVEEEPLGDSFGISYGPLGFAAVADLPEQGRVVATGAGFFGLTPEADGGRNVDLGRLEALRGEGRSLRLEVAPRGAVWAWGYRTVFRQDPDRGWLEEGVSNLTSGAIQNLSFEPDGAAVFSTSDAILRYGTEARGRSSATGPQVQLRSVELVEASGQRRRLPLAAGAPLELGQGDNSITFRYASPELADESGAVYRARLAGYETVFEDWGRARTVTYYRLEPGDYSFEVMARDAAGRVSQITPYRIVILPPWYRSPIANLVWLVLAALLLVLLTRRYVMARTQRLATEKSRLEGMVHERTAALEEANSKLQTIAHMDGLTGVSNRRRLDDYLDLVWVQSVERGRTLSVLIIDVDHFKEFNDRHGHLAGDQLLKKLVRTLNACLRRTEDLLARYGGEEFMVVMPGADAAAAGALAERMRATVEESSLGATISVGVATGIPHAEDDVTDLVGAADEALYGAKSAGRNCVRSAGD